MVRLSLIFFFFMVSVTSLSAQYEDRQRLVFFDVSIGGNLPEALESVRFLSRTLGNSIAKHQDLLVIDQSTRDSLLKQRKFNLGDCSKSECRFAMAKSLPQIDLLLEAEIQKLGNECVLSMTIKSVKTGGIVNSVDNKSSCEPDAFVDTLREGAKKIWPPPSEISVNQTNGAAQHKINKPVPGLGFEVPEMPARLRDGVGIEDPEASSMWNMAIGAESAAKQKPGNAADAWQKVSDAEVPADIARMADMRASTWRRFSSQQQADTAALLRIHDNEKLPLEQRQATIQRFDARYGAGSYRSLLANGSRIVIDSEPKGALIFPDAPWYKSVFGTGRTPDDAFVPAGNRDVTIYKRGYQKYRAIVFATPFSDVTLAPKLQESKWPIWFALDVGAGFVQGSVSPWTGSVELGYGWASAGLWTIIPDTGTDVKANGISLAANKTVANSIRLYGKILFGSAKISEEVNDKIYDARETAIAGRDVYYSNWVYRTRTEILTGPALGVNWNAFSSFEFGTEVGVLITAKEGIPYWRAVKIGFVY